MVKLTHRIATAEDAPAIIELMQVSILKNMASFLSADQIEAAKETMGIDWTLIEDETYFVVQTEHDGHSIMVGCGGWGKRRTLYGGDHTLGRDDSYSDPAVEAARIRAMYTHPEWIRCGVGSFLLELGEAAARDAGFKSIELGSTIPGEPFYLARDYVEVSRSTSDSANGAGKTVIKMVKKLQ